jgi:hypothetical protein
MPIIFNCRSFCPIPYGIATLAHAATLGAGFQGFLQQSLFETIITLIKNSAFSRMELFTSMRHDRRRTTKGDSSEG